MKFKNVNEGINIVDCWPFNNPHIDVTFKFSNVKWVRDSSVEEGCLWSSCDFAGKYIKGTFTAVEENGLTHVRADVTIFPSIRNFGWSGFEGNGLRPELETIREIVSDVC